MKNMKLILKGILIGIGKIIPGVSGSMIAISLGLYDKIINSISNIFIDFKENFIFLFKIGIGIVLSILLMSKLIVFALNNYYLPTILLFIGLIIGTIPKLIKIAKKDISIKNTILLVIPFIIFLIIKLFTDNVNINIDFNIYNVIWLGILEAITMIVPGISGTAIMLMLGVYEEILNMFTNMNEICLLILFIVGVIIGILILSKIIAYILKKYEVGFYYIIIGFVFSSIIILLGQTLENDANYSSIIIGLILLLLGALFSYKLE